MSLTRMASSGVCVCVCVRVCVCVCVCVRVCAFVWVGRFARKQPHPPWPASAIYEPAMHAHVHSPVLARVARPFYLTTFPVYCIAWVHADGHCSSIRLNYSSLAVSTRSYVHTFSSS